MTSSMLFALYRCLGWAALLSLSSCSPTLLPMEQASPPPPVKQELIEAVKAKDQARVKKLLESGEDPNMREAALSAPTLNSPGGRPEQKDTALMLAVRAESQLIVKLLLKHGADPNGMGEAGFTPLITAAQRGSLEFTKMLLAHKAKPDQRNSHGDTPIVFAANMGRTEVVEALLGAGADINGGSGWSPLMQAAYNGYEGTVAFLLKRGADPNYHPPGMMTPLECATAQYADEAAKLIRNAGGRGRSRAQLDADRKKAFEAYRKEEDARLKALAEKHKEELRVTEEDRLLIRLVLLDLASFKDKDFELSMHRGPNKLVLIDQTLGRWNQYHDGQMTADLEPAEAAQVTKEIRQSLQRRNSRPVSVKEVPFPEGSVLIRNADGGRPRMEDVYSSGADSKGWVQIHLPGYSDAKDAAVLRFSFGPTPHGAAGTVFLKKEQGTWKIVWRRFAHYL